MFAFLSGFQDETHHTGAQAALQQDLQIPQPILVGAAEKAGPERYVGIFDFGEVMLQDHSIEPARGGDFERGIAKLLHHLSGERLAELICQYMPEQFNHVYLVSGGSEAVESALKMARQHFVESGKPEKKQFIARQQSYHGNTLGALAVGGNEWRREPFKPILHPSHHIAPCYAYRYQQTHESELDYSLRTANELEAKILELGAENVSVMPNGSVIVSLSSSSNGLPLAPASAADRMSKPKFE